MKMKHKNGFTLIELLLVIAIAAILAIAAIPRFLDISSDAKQTSRDGIVGALRTGIALHRADQMISSGRGVGDYPTTLDSAANAPCSTTNPCFTNIIPNGVHDPAWVRIGDLSYSFNDGSVTKIFTYSPADGTFE